MTPHQCSTYINFFIKGLLTIFAPLETQRSKAGMPTTCSHNHPPSSSYRSVQTKHIAATSVELCLRVHRSCSGTFIETFASGATASDRTFNAFCVHCTMLQHCETTCCQDCKRRLAEGKYCCLAEFADAFPQLRHFGSIGLRCQTVVIFCET